MDNKWLNVGCGQCINPAAVNLDMAALPGVDVVHDLDVTPWPFADNQFPEVRAVQVFEHLHNPIGFMCEVYRVLRPGGLLWMSVPHYQSENSFTDPTHVRHCTLRTWDYWCHDTALGASHGPAYGGVKFTKRRVEWVGDDIQVELVK